MVSSDVTSTSGRHLRERVDELRLDVVRLASLTADAITAASAALVAGDLDAADQVVADDDAVDSLRHAIEDECLHILGRSGLADTDLRFTGVAMRVAHELERSADLAVNIAKTTWRLFPHVLDDTATRIVERLARQVVVQLRVAINAFADRDPSWAAALSDMDESTDDLEKSLFRHVLEPDGSGSEVSEAPDEATVLRAVQLALVARHYERIGDHTVTIAEQVQFVVTGERARPRHRR